jgi:hypothetical protein
VRAAQLAEQRVLVADPAARATICAPPSAGVNTASRSSTSAPRNNAVTGTSSAAASRASVVRLDDVKLFSIFESIALEIPARTASSPTVIPRARRWRRTCTAMARSSRPSTPLSSFAVMCPTPDGQPDHRRSP